MKSPRLTALAGLLLSVVLSTVPAAAQQAAPPAAPAREWSVKPEGSTLTYTLKHKLHEVEGKAAPTSGRARLLPDGTLQVAVRANVADFDSGNSNRDAHMKEVTEANKFPYVEFKGAANGVKLPETFPGQVRVTLEGEVTFHGVKQPVKVPMTVTFTSAKEARAEGTFELSLDAHKVERPSLMMVKVDDKLVLEPKLVLVGEGP
jgi:polyisoprenoid-binding protein YceI